MTLAYGFLTFALAAWAGCAAPHGSAAGATSRPHTSLIQALSDSIRIRNPVVANCEFLEIRAPFPGSRSRAAVARGIRADLVFSGNMADELLVVAVLDDSLTRIRTILDCYPTRRWNDYELRLTKVTIDSIRTEGRGATYGDNPMARAYAWDGR